MDIFVIKKTQIKQLGLSNMVLNCYVSNKSVVYIYVYI